MNLQSPDITIAFTIPWGPAVPRAWAGGTVAFLNMPLQCDPVVIRPLPRTARHLRRCPHRGVDSAHQGLFLLPAFGGAAEVDQESEIRVLRHEVERLVDDADAHRGFGGDGGISLSKL